MSTGVKIETNEIDGWTEKEATETKNPGGTRRRRRRTRRKQKIREEFDLLVWRPRKTSPHHAWTTPWRGTLSPPLWPSAWTDGRGEANWWGEGKRESAGSSREASRLCHDNGRAIKTEYGRLPKRWRGRRRGGHVVGGRTGTNGRSFAVPHQKFTGRSEVGGRPFSKVVGERVEGWYRPWTPTVPAQTWPPPASSTTTPTMRIATKFRSRTTELLLANQLPMEIIRMHKTINLNEHPLYRTFFIIDSRETG